jgi:hypothetical protein
MAKYRHRIFEMYEFRDEAEGALTTKSENLAPSATAPESWTLRHLAVSPSAGVTHVTFKEATNFADETIDDLREDFVQLADRLVKDSKVLLDFTGVVFFSPASIRALTQFHEKLRTKGSRLVLCCLDAAARDCFFAAR